MRPNDEILAGELKDRLNFFHVQFREMPGIQDPEYRDAFVEQLVESLRRIKYIDVISKKDHDPRRADAESALFDPLKAAVLHQRNGQIDEAFWLVFLFVHFGKHKREGWSLARSVYGRMGEDMPWDWARTSGDPKSFREWLAAHQATLPGKFGNHRKYQPLDAYHPRGTGAAVESYVNWVDPPRTHQMIIQDAHKKVGQNPRDVFHFLYRSMDAVVSFGRLAKFDYLTMIGKLGLAPIEPGSTYMQGSTGPIFGALLLFGGGLKPEPNRAELDKFLVELDDELHVGMQVLEDALCNWHKSPSKFIPFRG